jgi:hypothetical protein
MDFTVGVVDVGSPSRGKLGWAIVSPYRAPFLGTDLDRFVVEIAQASD